MRLISYAIFSIMAAAVVVAHAYQQRREFFTVVVHLSTSKISVALLGNAMLAIMLCLGSTVQALFFGKLREAEVERLWDKIKSSLFETCFAVTMFRDDIGSSFLLNFLGLLVLKWFHWLCHFRGEFMSQTVHTPALHHARALAAMVVLGFLDYFAANALYDIMIEKGINVTLIFAFEILVLFSLLVSTFLKYILYMSCSAWSGLRVCVFYINLAGDLFKIFAYLAFFSVVYSVIGIPLHIVGDVYQTLRSLQKRISDFLRYRSINTSINTRFPSVTAAELAQIHDPTCIICHSDMIAGDSCKRLPCCRRILHTECIKSWLEEHATCPTCRVNVMTAPLNNNNYNNDNNPHLPPVVDVPPAVVADAPPPAPAPAAAAPVPAPPSHAASSASHAPNSSTSGFSQSANSGISAAAIASPTPTVGSDTSSRNAAFPSNSFPLSPFALPSPAPALVSPRPAYAHSFSQLRDFVPCSPTGQPFVLPPPPLIPAQSPMFGASPFSGFPVVPSPSSHPSSPGSGRRLSRNAAVSLALQLAESSKEQYYHLMQAFEESEPAHCKALLHTVDNQLLPSITAASSSLRSLAASASSFDGVLLETKSRELGGIIDSFASLRKMITEKACQAQPVSPVSASTAAAIAAVATQRIAAASDAIVAPPPPLSAPNPFAAVLGPASSPRVSGSSVAAASNPSAAPNALSPQASSLPSVPDACAANSPCASSLSQPSASAELARRNAADAAERRRIASLSATTSGPVSNAKDESAVAVAAAVSSPAPVQQPDADAARRKDESKGD